MNSELWKQIVIETGIPLPKIDPDYDPNAEVGCWPFVDYDSEFIREATWHDFMYVKHERGELAEDWTREKVDLQFYRAMIKRIIYLSLSEDMTTVDLARLTRKAGFFMDMVNQFGGFYW